MGALPREYNANGLPKFGVDLSDDEGDAHCHYSSYAQDEEYNHEAYESGMDTD